MSESSIRVAEPTVGDPATTIDQLVVQNAAHAEAAVPQELAATPELKVAIVTCMDCRLDLASALGLANGDAHVIRNAGGVVTDDVIRSLAISQHKLGTREVMVIHHTRCGMQTLTDDGFRAELLEVTGTTPPWAVESFIDLEGDVRQSVRRIERSPYLLHRDAVRGFVYDVDTQRLRAVEAL